MRESEVLSRICEARMQLQDVRRQVKPGSTVRRSMVDQLTLIAEELDKAIAVQRAKEGI